MAKKKKLTKAERKEARLRKGKQWLLTYTGSPKKMNKHYRERFHVDAVTAARRGTAFPLCAHTFRPRQEGAAGQDGLPC